MQFNFCLFGFFLLNIILNAMCIKLKIKLFESFINQLLHVCKETNKQTKKKGPNIFMKLFIFCGYFLFSDITNSFDIHR